MQKATPMLRQYLELKKQYPGTLLFFRLGDFYELFNEDAILGSRELEITLTARQKNSPNPIPMCGVPHHAAGNYISKLVRKGYRVAICEQTEDASKTKKLVKREVVRIITPGTAIDEQLVEQKEPVYLAAVSGSGESFGIAYLELSTGEFLSTGFNGRDAWSKACADIESFAPKEILYPRSAKQLVENGFGRVRYGLDGGIKRDLFGNQGSPANSSITLTQRDNHAFDNSICRRALKKQFGVKDLSAYGLSGMNETINAAGACLNYALETQNSTARHISEIKFFDAADSMILDAVTLRNLDIVESGGFERSRKRSLLGVIDETITGMGARLLRSWLLRPSIKRTEIETRTAAVAELMDSVLRDKIRFLLKEVADLERLVGRLNLGTATARDLLALNRSLGKTPGIKESVSDASSLLLQVLDENILELPEIQDLISRSIDDEPPVNIADGGTIRDGFNNELDDLRSVSTNAKQTIAGFEEAERQRTGIGSLRVKFNGIFGYFIEISKANLARAPEDYERRQTLTNSERFTTPQLKEWESKVLGAEEKIKELELSIFKQVRSEIVDHTRQVQSTARALATLDALCSLAEVGAHRNYTRPELHDGDSLEIKNGRHAVVEAYSEEGFTPNDLRMNNSTDRLLVVTGANMGGKSTVLRQAAIIQILAQIGSFVPASYAKLPIIDRVWTRVGASDDLASGRSTFMVEMTETATILHNSTPRSLILLDEIGRGTSTFDGLAIAWAVVEYLHNSPKHSGKTLFATHYHELTELAEKLPGAKNYQMTAKEIDGEVVFLHKLEKGKASKSYGIAVAKLAGLPAQTIARANQVLEKLEQYELAVFSDKEIVPAEKGLEAAVGMANKTRTAAQVSLFAVSNEEIISELRRLKEKDLSPDDSKEILEKLKNDVL